MTVSSTTVKNSYSGDGSQTTFVYGYKIFADSDIKVIIRSSAGTETVKTITTHYTVTGAGSASGGNVVFTSGNIPTNTETVVLIRDVPQTQAIDYIANDPFPAETHEEGLDRATMTTQQMQEELDRSFKVSRTNTIASSEFTDSATTRASKTLGFDADGNLTLLDETTTPHYPRKIWKLTMTGEVVWEKEYDLYVNAFDIRDGFIYAPAQDLGGHRDAAWAFQSTEFHIVRVNIENGEMEKLVSFPKLPQNAYPVACKFMGNKLFCHTDRIWVFDYDTTLKNINKESMRLAYDFDIHRPQIQMTTFYGYVNAQYVEADHQQKYTLADNGKAHPDGVHYYISGQNKLFKMKLRDENRKPVPVLN